MVGRLMKHELYALFRVLVFLYAAVILFAVLLRISIPAGEVYSNEQASVVLIFSLFYVYAIFAAILAATIMGISRFFKTIFTREGYLTLSFSVDLGKALVYAYCILYFRHCLCFVGVHFLCGME